MAGGAGGSGTFRDDIVNLLLSGEVADHIAERMATRFHTVAQKLKGGVLSGAQGVPGADPGVKNQFGGKGIIKFNPSNDEITAGVKQQVSLFTWQSPDGLPHYVTIDVGRFGGNVGGPGADGTKGGLVVVSPVSPVGQGSVGGGSWPAGSDSTGAPLYYRASAQVLIGTPGTMQDPFYIDINRGQRITALASYVAVTAQMNGPPVDELTGQPVVPLGFSAPYTSGSLAVYATLGVAVAPTLAPALYTQYIDAKNVAGGANVFTRTLPPRANFLFPVIPVGNGDIIQLVFFNNAGIATGATPLITYGNPSVNGLPIAPIPLADDYYGVALSSNNGAGSVLNYRLVYQLSV